MLGVVAKPVLLSNVEPIILNLEIKSPEAIPLVVAGIHGRVEKAAEPHELKSAPGAHSDLTYSVKLVEPASPVIDAEAVAPLPEVTKPTGPEPGSPLVLTSHT